MSGHTPGPWHLFDNADHFVIGVGELNGDGITDCGFGVWRGKSEEAHANARLIAAAPDLLEALKALLEHQGVAGADPLDMDNEDIEAERMARTAIAKATGKGSELDPYGPSTMDDEAYREL